MLKICYFASVRERLGKSEEHMVLPDQVATVGQLSAVLASRGEPWNILADERSVLIAVNQQISSREQQLQGSEEVAFFPPMTGG